MIVRKIMLVTIVIVIILFCVTACSNNNGKMPKDFNFSLNFGLGGGINCIDTYNGTFTKDLIRDGTETIKFTFSADKMTEIYEAFLEYEIFDLPDDSSAESLVTPEFIYILTYTCNKKNKTITCNNVYGETNKSLPDVYNRFVNFAEMIRAHIYSTEEYQNMPKANGGYF